MRGGQLYLNDRELMDQDKQLGDIHLDEDTVLEGIHQGEDIQLVDSPLEEDIQLVDRLAGDILEVDILVEDKTQAGSAP